MDIFVTFSLFSNFFYFYTLYMYVCIYVYMYIIFKKSHRMCIIEKWKGFWKRRNGVKLPFFEINIFMCYRFLLHFRDTVSYFTLFFSPQQLDPWLWLKGHCVSMTSSGLFIVIFILRGKHSLHKIGNGKNCGQ